MVAAPSYSKKRLGRVVSVATVSFCVAELICLAMVFAGCTSPFSPFDLYFMKVDLGDSAGQEKMLTRRVPDQTARGMDNAGVTTRSRPWVVDQDVGGDPGGDPLVVPPTVARRASSDLGPGPRDTSPELPEYYHVGLFGYCQGQNGAIASCSRPAVSFSFNLGQITQSAAPRLHQVDPPGETFLNGNPRSSQSIIALYISALVTGFIASILGVKKIFVPDSGTPRLLAATISTILVTVATSWAIAFYSFYTQQIEQSLNQYGVHASLGVRMLASSCLAVAFSLASVCMNFWLTHL